MLASVSALASKRLWHNNRFASPRTIAIVLTVVLLYLFYKQATTERSQQPLRVSPRHGYVLALHYSDQMTIGIVNLISLQCWALSLGPAVRVVEPFLRGSVFGVDDQHRLNMNNTTTSEDMKSVKLTDVYDEAGFKGSNYAPLVSWDYFIRNSPRRVIIVEKECFRKGKCFRCGTKRSEDLLRSIQVITQRYGFKVVHRVCYPMKSMPYREFRNLIYKEYASNEVVVVFNVWGGIDNEAIARYDRVAISDMDQCRRSGHIYDFVGSFALSAQLKHDATEYTRRYLTKAKYISVMVRLEQFYIKHGRFKGMTDEKVLSLLNELYQKITKKVAAFKLEHNIDEVFLTMDCRKQGSNAFSRTDNKMALMSNSIASLYEMLYGNSSSMEDWDESFYRASSFRNKGYIAMLQKHLAASGTCLITAGGGSFQGTAKRMYYQYHQRNRCSADFNLRF